MKFFLASIAFVYTIGAFGQAKTDCIDVRTGSFTLTSEYAGTTYIKRTKKHQIETGQNGDYKAKFDVVWLDDCTYQLRLKKLIKGPQELEGNDGDVLTVKILNIENGKMDVVSTSNFSDIELKAEIKIID